MTAITYLERAWGIAPLLTGTPTNGETDDSLDRLAQCAFQAAREARQTGDITRLLHVADHDVPRLLLEIDRLKRASA